MRLLRTVNYNLYLTSIFFSMVCFVSCNIKNDNSFVSKDEYLEYAYYDDTTNWCEKSFL